MSATTRLMSAIGATELQARKVGVTAISATDSERGANIKDQIRRYDVAVDILTKFPGLHVDQIVKGIEFKMDYYTALRVIARACIGADFNDLIAGEKAIESDLHDALTAHLEESIDLRKGVLDVFRDLKREAQGQYPDLTELDSLKLRELFVVSPIKNEKIEFVSFSPDRSRIAVGDSGGNLFIHDGEHGAIVDSRKFDGKLTAGAFHPNGNLVVASLSHVSQLHVIDGKGTSLKLEPTLPVHNLAFSSKGLGTLSYDGALSYDNRRNEKCAKGVHLFSANELHRPWNKIHFKTLDLSEGTGINDRTTSVFSLRFSRKTNELVVGSGWHILRFFNTESWQLRLKTDKRGETAVGATFLDFSPERLVTGSWWGVEFIDPQTGQVILSESLKPEGTPGGALINVALPGNGRFSGTKLAWGDPNHNGFHIGVLEKAGTNSLLAERDVA